MGANLSEFAALRPFRSVFSSFPLRIPSGSAPPLGFLGASGSTGGLLRELVARLPRSHGQHLRVVLAARTKTEDKNEDGSLKPRQLEELKSGQAMLDLAGSVFFCMSGKICQLGNKQVGSSLRLGGFLILRGSLLASEKSFGQFHLFVWVASVGVPITIFVGFRVASLLQVMPHEKLWRELWTRSLAVLGEPATRVVAETGYGLFWGCLALLKGVRKGKPIHSAAASLA